MTIARTLLVPEPGKLKGHSESSVWPLPALDNEISPTIIESSTDIQGIEVVHLGYQGNASPANLVPVLAVRAGVIAYAARVNDGATLCIHHPGGWSTQYENLADLAVLPTDRFRHGRNARVRAGDVLGYLRYSPFRVRFSLSQLAESGLVTIDPARHLRSWSVLSWSDSSLHPRKRLAA